MTAAPAGQHTVRRHNVQLLLAALSQGTASRALLAEQTGLTKATVSSLVDSLIRQQVLTEGRAEAGGPGRPSRPVRLNPDGLVALGVEINVDYVSAALVDLTGQLREHRIQALDNTALSAPELAEAGLWLARQLISETDRTVVGAGLAVPGVVDDAGVLIRIPNLAQLTGIDLVGTFSRGLGNLAVQIENEANCGALAWQRSGAEFRRSAHDFVYVSGDVGVGAGLVVSNELFRGFGGFAGELGHVVVDRNGPECPCGGRGCVERLAGLPALLAASGQQDLAALRLACDSGNKRACASVAKAGGALGVGLASLLNVVDLPIVVLGGMFDELFDAVSPSLTAELNRRVLSSKNWGDHVHRAGFGADAGVRGAAGLVIDRLLRDPDSHQQVDLGR